MIATNPWVLLDVGLWLTFVVWAIALDMCARAPEGN